MEIDTISRAPVPWVEPPVTVALPNEYKGRDMTPHDWKLMEEGTSITPVKVRVPRRKDITPVKMVFKQ